MRKVECTRITYERDGNNRKTIVTKVQGLFHQWGNEYEELDTGPGNYSVGLVELQDGKMETFIPERIRFTSSEPESKT